MANSLSYQLGDEIITYNTRNTFIIEKGPLQGGMGCVYIARRKKDGKQYALKTVLPRNDEVSDNQLELFHWESQVWIVLGKHSNIVQAHWFDTSREYDPFLIMEYIAGFGNGVTLADWLVKHGKGDLRSVLSFMIQALTGLIYARNIMKKELGLDFIHRDLKPQNIFLNQDYTAKVSDFGLVKAFSGKDGIGGTPQYMPPEQWEGNEVAEKSDVYALGCIMYEMLSGKVLFDIPEKKCKNRRQIYQLHLNKKPEPMPDVPDSLNSIIQKCLTKKSDERFDFNQLRQNLQKLHKEYFDRLVPVKDDSEPFTADDWNCRGSGFDQLGFQVKALGCYNHAIAQHADDERFFLNRGNAHLKLNEWQKAIADFIQSVKINPGYIESYLGMANIYFLKREYDKALEIYAKAKGLNPEEERVYLGRGNVYAKLEQYDRALDEFMKALQINKNLAEAYFNIGNLYVCLNEIKKALGHYKKALLLKKGKYPRAQEMIDRFTKI